LMCWLNFFNGFEVWFEKSSPLRRKDANIC
jgi:hypothetical protein